MCAFGIDVIIHTFFNLEIFTKCSLSDYYHIPFVDRALSRPYNYSNMAKHDRKISNLFTDGIYAIRRYLLDAVCIRVHGFAAFSTFQPNRF